MTTAINSAKQPLWAPTTEVLRQAIWAPDAYPEYDSLADRVCVSYQRARSLVQHIGLTVDDILQLSPKFWAFYTDYIITADTAVATILVIHWNVVMGTIAAYAHRQPELAQVLLELQRFDLAGDFMLSEVGHGLDTRNIETTATQNSDGSFDLHTPGPAAAKSMPPTTLFAQMPRIAVVFARLIVGGQQRGIRPFLVRINGVNRMEPGVTSHLLPSRPGAKPVDHSITSFDHVRLEASSLLGDLNESEKPRLAFLRQIHRITLGALSLSMTNIPILRLSAYILGRYSQRRCVAGAKPDERVPIITFSSQHTPILTALTLASILEAYANDTINVFRSQKDPQVQAALACTFKQTATSASQAVLNELIDRCGWQGLYAHNQVIELVSAVRGNSIAEGDILVLCIRLVSEVLLGRYAVPKPRDPTGLLAQHEIGIWKEAEEVSAAILASGVSHRAESFNSMILPRCRKLVEAIGHRMAYEAAAASSKVTPEMVRLYETMCILENPAWYVEHKGFSGPELHSRHVEAVRKLLPSLEAMLDDTEAEPWATAPILDDSRWEDFVQHLSTFSTSSTGTVTMKQGTMSAFRPVKGRL